MSLEITNPNTLTTVVIIVLILFAIIYVYMNHGGIGIDNFANYPVLAGDIVQLQGGLASVMDGTTPVPTSIDNMIQQAMNNLVPPLSIIAYYGTNPPDGWQICDGTTLFYANTNNSMIVRKGSGASAVTIYTPDLRGRTIIGINPSSSLTGISMRNLKDAGGAETHTLLINQIPSHSHDTIIGFKGDGQSGYSYGAYLEKRKSASEKTGGNASGGTDPHNNMQPFYTLNYIIKQPIQGKFDTNTISI
jgi:microcystin-dependent protein